MSFAKSSAHFSKFQGIKEQHAHNLISKSKGDCFLSKNNNITLGKAGEKLTDFFVLTSEKTPKKTFHNPMVLLPEGMHLVVIKINNGRQNYFFRFLETKKIQEIAKELSLEFT